MSQNNLIGSTWNKWDLHVHTPCSIVQNYGGDTEKVWDAFIADLEQLPPDFKVIGINDYLFVDGYERVLEEKGKGRLKNIALILPVVELRLDKFAGVVKKDEDGVYSKSDWNRINLHIIFDQLEPEVIRQQFLSHISPRYSLIPEDGQLQKEWHAVITRHSVRELGQMIINAAPADEKSNYADPLREGFNNLCFNLETVFDTLSKNHCLKNRFLTAIGKAEWNNMKWNNQSIAEKRHVINCADIVFSSLENPEAYSVARESLKAANVQDKLLDCSDAHALSSSRNKDRIGHCFTWIKAVPTFEGLRQAVKIEFDQRVFVGDIPPKRLLVSGNRTKYLSAIAINKKAGSALTDPWFDAHIPLNHDLVAIIGNKGSGKSALADIISLVGDTSYHNNFSFLNETRFCNSKAKLATHFSGTLHWQDGTISQQDLHESPSPTSVERVKYLPQNYLETLCNELAGEGSSTFDKELRKIIYTHVPEEERISYSSLDELLDFKVAVLEAERQQWVDKLSKINAEIVAVERKLSPEHLQSLEQQRDNKKNELASLEKAKPTLVNNSLASEANEQEPATAKADLDELEKKLKLALAEEQAARQKQAKAVKGVTHIARILQAIKNHQETHARFINELDAMLADAELSLKAGRIASFEVDTAEIEQLGANFKKESETQTILLSNQDKGSLSKRREAIEAGIKTIKSQLNEKERLFVVYKEQLTEWERSKAALQGAEDKSHTIAWYTAAILELGRLPDKLKGLKAERLDIVRNLHAQINSIVTEYRLLYQPVQSFVQSTEQSEMPIPLNFDVQIMEEGFQDSFLNRINRQMRGSFAGIDESERLVRSILKETDFMNVDAVVFFVKRIDDMLHFDQREDANPAKLSVADQLRKGNQVEDLYNFLFGLKYLKPQYFLKYDGQEIGQLSPGERGLLLLIFYLLVDKNDIPLVIDQPEENLDNQTIYKILVTCIKKAKQRRQVIMVTHNPNLAVVCDAEQIICAKCDKANKRFTYISGAVESLEIKSCVIEILEGTQPAFKNRQEKYGF